MSTLRLVAVALLAFTATDASAAAAAGTTLKWSIKQGETLKYSFIQNIEMKVVPPQRKDEVLTKVELNVDMTWTGKSTAADGAIEVAMVVDRARFKIIHDGVPIAYDSKDKSSGETPETRELAMLYEAVVGQPYTLKISPQGEVLDVKVPETVTAVLPKSQFAATADSGSLMTTAGVKNLLAQVFPKFPKAEVDKGTTWSTSIPLPAGLIQMLIKTDYTVGEVTPVAKVDAKIDASITTTAPGLEIKLTKQSGSAKFDFDAAAGRMTDSTITQTLDMSLSVKGEELKQSVTTHLTFKLAK